MNKDSTYNFGFIYIDPQAGLTLYSIMAFGIDKGFIAKKCTGNLIDNTLKRLFKDEPFLGYRIIFYDIIYDKIDKQKAEESKKDLKSVFIIELKQ